MKEFPLTLPQRDIYFDQMAFPCTPIYNIGAKIIIEGPLDPDILERAYRAMIDQHDTFHSLIVLRDAAPYMCVQEDYEYNWQFHDFEAQEDPMAAADEFCELDFIKPFDLSGGEILSWFHLIRIRDDYHYLYSRYHHLTTDGWGASLLFTRLIEFYNELKEHGQLKERAGYSYSLLSEYEDEYLQKEFHKDIEYWKYKLGSPPADLWPGRSGSKENGLAGGISGREEWFVERGKYDQIVRTCEALKVSLFHFWIGMLATYFCKQYGVDDIVFGLPILNRSTARFKQTVGTFMMITPFRTAVDVHRSFSDLILEIKQELRKDYKHQRLPLSSIAESVRPGWGHERRIYSVFFSYEKHDYSATISGCQTQVIPLTHHMERVPVAVYIREFDADRAVKIDFDHNYSYFDTPSCKLLLEHFRILLDEVLADPHRPLSGISFLTFAERQKVVREFPQSRLRFSVNGTFPELFRERAEQAAMGTCIISGSKEITYGKALESSLRIAGLLQSRGIGRNDIVALMVGRSDTMLLLMCGILQAGAAHLAIDPEFPPARIQYILRDSGAKVLILQRKYAALAGEGEMPFSMIFWDEAYQGAELPGNLYTPVRIDEEDTAYMLYTSGSTGLPKGVLISHGSLLNFLLSMRDILGFSEGERLLAVTTYSFDISLLELYLPLICGATVIIADSADQRDPFRMKATIGSKRPSIIQGTPGFWSLLVDAGWRGSDKLKLLCGGESLKPGLAGELLGRCASLWNMYGPTETTIWSTVKRIGAVEEFRSIGRPIGNTEVFILNRDMQPVSIGIDGEIYIGGAGVAKGYHNRPELTAEKFVVHPFGQESGQEGARRLYRTGDIGRWLPDGEIAFSGRMDHQVKVRGYRIELPEIEHVLTLHEAVAEALVMVKEDTCYDKELVAFVVLKKAIGTEMLKAFVIDKLPRYMAPDHWVILERFPMTPNGKIDRKSLMSSPVMADEIAEVREKDLSAGENELAGIWRDVLGQRDISGDANFFERGGNSFKILSLINSIQRQLLVTLTFTDIFMNPALRAQAELIARKKPTDAGGAICAQSGVHAEKPYYLTAFQHHIWMVSQQREGAMAYMLRDAYFIEGTLDHAILERIGNLLMERHEILRSVIRLHEGKPCLEIESAKDYPSPVEWRSVKQLAAVTGMMEAMGRKKVSFEKGPLWEMALFPLSTGGNILYVMLHHLICDGGSLNILIREFFEIYQSLLDDKQWLPRPLLSDFSTYAAWRRQFEDSDAYRQAEDYWREVFRSRPAITISMPERGPIRRSYRGRVRKQTIGRELKSKIEKLAERCSASPFIVVLSAFYRLLYNEFSNKDITICIPIAARESEEWRDLIGVFTDTVALRVQMQGMENAGELIEKVKRVFLKAYEHHLYPLHRLAEMLEEIHGMESAGLLNIMLNYQHLEYSVEKETGGGRLRISRFQLPQEWSKLDLSLNFYDSAEELVFEVEYSTGVFTEDQAERITDGLTGLLESFARQPEGARIISKQYEPDGYE